jgi:anaerobic magnesium-protoporphyrin IX monomethyl ester cyclase
MNGNVLLIFPPPDKQKETRFGVPMGLLYLATPLIKNGFQVKVANLTNETRISDLFKNYIEWSDVVGVSVPSYCRLKAIQLVQKIKEKYPCLPVIVGGPDCILFQEKFPYSDVTVTGEAENIIVELVRRILFQQNLECIPGLIYQNSSGLIKSTDCLYPNTELDQFDFPYRSLLAPEDEYGQSNFRKMALPKSTEIISSRGCPRHCRFCSRNALTYSCYRERGVENVLMEFCQVANQGYKMVWISDDNFTVNVPRAIEIFNGLANKQLNINIALSGWVGSASKELYQSARTAGVRIISFGLESGNQDVLDFYQKGITVDQIKKAVMLADECGLFTVGNFIIGAPFETNQHFSQTLALAQELPLDSINIKILGYMAGSSLWLEQVKKGNIAIDERNVFADKNRGLCNYTLEELKKVVSNSYKQFWQNPSRQIRLKKKILELGFPYQFRLD